MRRVLTLIALIGSAMPASGESCAALGLKSPYLTHHFCEQLKGIGEGKSPTRGMEGDSFKPSEPALSGLPEFTILKDAYRADPRKTLELIRRIKEAGGLTSN